MQQVTSFEDNLMIFFFGLTITFENLALLCILDSKLFFKGLAIKKLLYKSTSTWTFIVKWLAEIV